MKKTVLMSLMSVPVAIMSTVTTMRGLYEWRNSAIRSSGLRPVVRQVPLVHLETGLDGRAAFDDAGIDAVDIEVDVDAVGHRLLVAVLHDEVLVEEADGLLGGGGGQADQEGVEVLQHLPSEVIDGAVALVGHDEVEGLDGDSRVVRHRT